MSTTVFCFHSFTFSSRLIFNAISTPILFYVKNSSICKLILKFQEQNIFIFFLKPPIPNNLNQFFILHFLNPFLQRSFICFWRNISKSKIYSSINLTFISASNLKTRNIVFLNPLYFLKEFSLFFH